MNCLMSRKWWSDVLIRMIKTGAETALALMGTNMFITEVNWLVVASGTALSMVATLFFNIKEIEE